MYTACTAILITIPYLTREAYYMNSAASSFESPSKITGQAIRIVAVVVLGAFLALLNQTVMSPALPMIMKDFNIDAGTGQWIMSVYPLVSGIMVPVSAYLINRFSTRKLFFASILIFAGGTLLCAVAPSFTLLIVGRVLQAGASGILLPLVAVVPMLVFPVEKRGTAMGMAGIVMSAGPAIGPVAGGAVIDAMGWRAMLAFIVPLALITLVLGIVMLKNVGALTKPKFDALSVVLCTIAFGGLLYSFSSASSAGWLSFEVIVPVILGALCLVLFIRRQFKLDEPLLDLSTLKNPTFRSAALIVTLINAACLVTNTLFPLLLQTVHGASAFETGMAMLPAAAVGIILSPISGIIFDRFGAKAISIVGLVMMTGALWALSFSSAATPIVLITILCTLQATGQVLANMPVNTWGINALSNDKIAHGNAIANTGRQVAGGLSTALIVTIMTSVTTANMQVGVVDSTALGIDAGYFACTVLGVLSLLVAIVAFARTKKGKKTASVASNTSSEVNTDN